MDADNLCHLTHLFITGQFERKNQIKSKVISQKKRRKFSKNIVKYLAKQTVEPKSLHPLKILYLTEIDCLMNNMK